MELARKVIFDVVSEFGRYRPEEIRFFGEDGRLVSLVSNEFIRYCSDVRITQNPKAYSVNVDALAEKYLPKKR